VDGWTVIPGALYDNDLSDLELQEFYVREAEQKWRDFQERRRELQAALNEAIEAELRARAFLDEAEAALKKYRCQAEAQADPRAEVAEARVPPRPARALPKPKGRRGQR
jgi:hypothetical protein